MEPSPVPTRPYLREANHHEETPQVRLPKAIACLTILFRDVVDYKLVSITIYMYNRYI